MEKKIRVPSKPFILYRYGVSFLGVRKSVWELMVKPRHEARGNRIISKQEALAIIRQQNLTLCAKEGDEEIWESALRPFQQKYTCYYTQESQKRKTQNAKYYNSKKETRSSAMV